MHKIVRCFLKTLRRQEKAPATNINSGQELQREWRIIQIQIQIQISTLARSNIVEDQEGDTGEDEGAVFASAADSQAPHQW